LRFAWVAIYDSYLAGGFLTWEVKVAENQGSGNEGLAPLVANNKMSRRFSHMVARAWSDESFKKRLLSAPQDVFSEYSLVIPAGVKIVVLEDSTSLIHFVLPPKPNNISSQKLDSIEIPLYPAETFDCHDSNLSLSGPTKCDYTMNDDGTL
jgi:hypothetical protein